jgi:hypothetical protein
MITCANAGLTDAARLYGYRGGPGRLWIGVLCFPISWAVGCDYSQPFFFAALGMLMIMAVFIVVSRLAETSSPWWLGILGFVCGVLDASYIRLKHYSLFDSRGASRCRRGLTTSEAATMTPLLSPFARFEDLVKRLISVPKGEVDELQRVEEKKKRPEEA